jgi:hypothetical protein
MERDDERSGDDMPTSGSAPADEDYGFSGRHGFEEGNYSGAYGRGTAGAHDTPSASGLGGAGYARGGNSLPTPDPADVQGADQVVDERTTDDTDRTDG